MQKEPRPKIKPELTQYEIIIEIAGWALLAVLWIIPLMTFNKLTDTVPIHFDLHGDPDRYGSRLWIFFFPLLGTLLFAGLTILNRFPHVFNYPVKITEENAERQYILATRMIRYMKIAILLVFLMVTWTKGMVTTGKSSGFGPLFLPLMLVLLFYPLVTFIARSYKEK